MVARQCEIHKREPTANERRILADQPRLDGLTREQVMLVVECWFTCSADRTMGFSTTSDIPSLAVRAWAKEERLDRDARRLLVRVIRHVDSWWSKREAEKRKLEG